MENDLKFAGSRPVIVNFNGSADDIYAPVSTESCDITIVDDKILDDLYTAEKDGVWMRVYKEIPSMAPVIDVVDPGSVTSVEITPSPDSLDNHNIYQRNLFFTDINGDYRFNGKIINQMSNIEDVNLLYNPSTKRWERNDDWNLGPDGRYFNDGTYSYKVIWDGTRHYISKWNGSTWGTEVAYNYVDNGTSYDCAYGVDEIVHLTNGSIELLFSQSRFTWDATNMRWLKTTSYTDNGGDTYFSMAGEWYHRIKDSNGVLCDTCVANAMEGGDYIVKLNPSTGKFDKMIKLSSTYDIDNLFTDNDGNVYYVKSAGEVYFWDWGVEKWYKWLTFGGSGYQGNTFGLDYVITGTDKTVVIKYINGSGTNSAIYLEDIEAPVLSSHLEPTGGVTVHQLFEGFLTPNTYSQPVTQNLDQITLTGVDYLSILKYVTIDKLFNKPGIVSYMDIFASAIAYVGGDLSNYWPLAVEKCVSYGGSYYGNNDIMNLRIQLSNFWDESGEASTLYEVFEELLRPFCMKIVWPAYLGPIIYNANNTSLAEKTFIEYDVNPDGSWVSRGEYTQEDLEPYIFYFGTDWKSNNTQDASVEIDSTYSKVTGTASTCVPSYSKMAIDLVDYTQRDKYDAGWLNVQTNKTKGYVKRIGYVNPRPGQWHPVTVIEKDTADHWFYLWNGVYVNADYGLEPFSSPVDWYLNINKCYEYLMETTTSYGADHGSILNFYGGSVNPTGTGKSQATEKAVEIKKRITAYAADNGVPPELLDITDLDWTYSRTAGPMLQKSNTSNTKFGDGIVMQSSNRIVYKQSYENVELSEVQDHIVDFQLTHSFSRTGEDVFVDVMQNNTATNKTYYQGQILQTCDSYYFPDYWNADKVEVNSYYFRRYSSTGTGGASCRAVWDERRVNLYVKLSDDSYLQFNGKDWVTDNGSHNYPFYLMKLMNGETLYHTDFKYDVIRSAADANTTLKYTLKSDDLYIYYDNNYGVTDKETNDYTRCKPYGADENAWKDWIAGCSEGQLSIKLPYINDPAATVYVEVYNASMLGMTGADGSVSGAVTDHMVDIYYTLTDEDEVTRNFKTASTYFNFLPANVSHIKAEHLDLKISVTVPESNLGQMFSQSDIQYQIDGKNNFEEEYTLPSFRVNTSNQLVQSSYSYLMFGSTLADPGEFIVNGLGTRPECFTLQAYFNWLSVIRKIYSKTLVPNENYNRMIYMNNIQKFITSPEVGENNLMVVSDSVDVKTNRHSIVAVECHNLDVDYINPYIVNELPHSARNERWNLPTAQKN